MKVIDKILNEWSFRCHDGIVDMNDPIKLSILNEVLEENNIANINESIELSFTNFENVIRKNHDPNNKVIGLEQLYKIIKDHPENEKLFNLIETSNKSLNPGVDSMTKLEEILFQLIYSNIKISNGHPSELWFAIIYDGKIVGGKKDPETGDASADVDVKGKRISLKNYKDTSSVDLGTIPSKAASSLIQTIYLFKSLTGIEPDVNLSTTTLNNILQQIKEINFEDNLKKFLELPGLTDSSIGNNIYNLLVKKLDQTDNIETKADEFVKQLNNNILDKINKVDYWILIEGDKIYIKSSEESSKKLTSNINYISPSITSLKNNHIFVNKSSFFKNKTSDSEVKSEKITIPVGENNLKGKSVSIDWYNNPGNKEFKNYFDKEKIKNGFIGLKSNANVKLTEELTDYLVEIFDPKGHFQQRINERGNVLDILNLNEIPLKDYNAAEVKEKLKSDISNEIKNRATKILEKESIPSSNLYEVGIKVLKPILISNGKEYSLKLFAKSITIAKDGSEIEKDNIGTLYFATIYDNKATTLLLLNKEDDSELYFQIKKHAEGKPGREDKEAKILTPPNYIYRIDLDELMGNKVNQQELTLIDPVTLPYELRTDYRTKEKFEHKKFGTGTIVNTSSGTGGKGDSRGIVSWVDVQYKPYASGGVLKNIRRFENIYTKVSPLLKRD